MNLITLDNVSLAFGAHALLDQVKLQITAGERVCLIGRNGAGKSSLLKIIDGSLLPDSGQVSRKPNLRLARLEQELPQKAPGTVYDFVAEGLANTGKLLAEYHTLVNKLAGAHDATDLAQLEKLQHEIDHCNGWQFDQQIKTILQRLELDAEKTVAELSGGWQRRVALAKALVVNPELLLLDEPTNHLDIEAIQWLENQLLSTNIAIIFITHDRALLRRLATRIIELDRGQLTSWPGDYDNFLVHKEELLNAEAKHQSEFDKKLAQEEVWIRQGIKARRTRNEGRVRALEALRKERTKRREQQGLVKLNVNEAEKSGQLVIDAENISQFYNDVPVINHFSLRIMRGDRIGLIGPNGVGKSTLLNILLGHISPQKGKVTFGTKLKIAYFDQLRQTLDMEKTVIENVVQGSEMIEINGKPKHIMSYLADFLFAPNRALAKVKALSGGECNRLLLAKLLSQPSNLLVLDEPTNDLDVETLELLEELLGQYQGTILLVSHDRAFLDNVVTSTLAFEGQGKINEYVGGYADYLRQKPKTIERSTIENITEKNNEKSKNVQNKKLSYKEQRELNELPKKIEILEAEQLQLQNKIAATNFYQNAPSEIKKTMDRLNQLSTDIQTAYDHWAELEQK